MPCNYLCISQCNALPCVLHFSVQCRIMCSAFLSAVNCPTTICAVDQAWGFQSKKADRVKWSRIVRAKSLLDRRRKQKKNPGIVENMNKWSIIIWKVRWRNCHSKFIDPWCLLLKLKSSWVFLELWKENEELWETCSNIEEEQDLILKDEIDFWKTKLASLMKQPNMSCWIS